MNEATGRVAQRPSGRRPFGRIRAAPKSVMYHAHEANRVFGRVRDGTLFGALARFSPCATTLARQRMPTVLIAIDGTPAIRRIATGTEIYARSIIEALAASRRERVMRVYANAVDPPPWLPDGVEWR